MSLDVMRLALDALCDFDYDKRQSAITALRAAIEQTEQPVAWMWADGTITTDPDRADGTWTPLYTAPRQWQGLTEQEIKDCEKQAMVNGSLPFEQRSFFARAIEAKLKEKNG